MKKLEKIIQLFNTIKFLKFKQVYYRFFYLFRNKFRRVARFSQPITMSSESHHLYLSTSIAPNASVSGEMTFVFLNRLHTFEDKIDWNYAYYGKLWTYNLTYFEFLLQEKLKKYYWNIQKFNLCLMQLVTVCFLDRWFQTTDLCLLHLKIGLKGK